MGSPKQIQALFLTLVGFLFTSASSLAVTIDELNAQKEFERRQAEIQAKKPEELAYMPQGDAFASAAEHSTFLAAHQMYFGPYGFSLGKEEQDKIIKNTAEAIDHCLKGGNDCTKSKQEMIVKALVHFNLGHQIKHMMVVNNTNRENIKSIQNQSQLDQAAIEESVRQGKDFIYRNETEKYLATKEGKESAGTIKREGSTAKPRYFQLDENDVLAPQQEITDAATFKNDEILGHALTQDYAMLIENYATDKNGAAEQRFYKFVSVDNNKGEKTEVLAMGKDGNPIVEERFAEIKKEQASPGVTEAVTKYKEVIASPQFDRRLDEKGQNIVFNYKEGFDPEKLGMGRDLAAIDPNELASTIKVDDLPTVINPETNRAELKGINRHKATVRYINQAFKETAEDGFQKNRGPQSIGGSEIPLGAISVTLDPQKFSEFLDNIWPTAERRRELQNQ